MNCIIFYLIHLIYKNDKQVTLMPLSDQQKDKLEAAFHAAVNQKDMNSMTNESQFEAGAEKVFSELYDEVFSQNSENYDGIIFNQYKISKQIGSGGMGSVYLANRIDGQYDKTVAIKVLTKGFNNQNIKDRFLREKQILAQLRHPNIVPLLDAGTTDDGIPWFVLEFIDGKNISEFCQSKKLDIKSIAKLLIKICDSIQFAHSQGIIHRDLKPANILIENADGDYNPVILDFGIAHQEGSGDLTNQGNLIGTPGYMSPEQIKGIETIDPRSDVFSLGVVMYQLFTHNKPFKGDSGIEIHQSTINSTPEKLNKLIPSFPKDLQIIVETCLKKKRSNRYQSALNLKQDIENWLNGYPINAKKEPVLKSFWRLIKRNKVIAMITSFSLIAALLLTVKYTYDIKQEQQIALQANAESDDLFSFLIKDLHAELTDIGRIDILQSVAEKNLQHLNKYNFKLSTPEKLKYASAYRNVASVLEMQQDTAPSISAFSKARDILLTLDSNQSFLQQKSSLLALTYTDLAGLHAKLGLLDLANAEHGKALTHAKTLVDLNTENANEILWAVIHPLSWNLMEQSKYEQAKIYLDQAIKLSLDSYNKNNENIQWLTKRFKSQIAMGWYYIDLRQIDSSINFYKQAMETANKLLSTSQNSVPFLNNLQKTNNQIAYAYVLKKDYPNAIKHAQQAIEYGQILHIRAPDNLVYYRALSYSYTMLGNAYNEEKNYKLAEVNFKSSLDITEIIANSSPENSLLQNDLAVDMLNFADLLGKKGEKKREKKYWELSEKLLEQIATQQDASIYYVDTYVYVLLIQGKFDLAQPYLLRMKNTEGWPNESYQKYINEYGLYQLESDGG
jgi:serine/threonine protein kinase